ncbi:RING finger protein B [Chiloscyllium plagiosum]|uniref:RING finger protein B n=1 Tax=Chiloscyllium plagiosum TaxID=36176 RepID=UPI001CB7BC16|nr:RING finger protein B [Chiloscyllium plagiosum]XP_043550150.1 RING finger protein B [Chiloscyllium plagiosum]XP_043550151.1 RING finger protein B [Chiloscyllium plagiosum]XP_043550152.1 RING finger protein B [Chiloscyllium plagiosum]XP_043550153.1 RING finger protein B [Chiloscyllium plagiosum]XP_043550154.1 RING finger protein B [Chiloscyllium plagiosum]XP_043550155.1 RING finger protein B [Chiloscyllium plagiosum]
MQKGIGQPVWRQLSQSKAAPLERYKHGCCIYEGYMYLYGGRRQTGMRDFWRYNIAQNDWEELDRAAGTAPEELEEPSLVAHEGMIYVFGGMMDSAYTQGRTPLWIYDIDGERWTWWHQTFSSEVMKQVPKNRKGHTAVVFEAQMYVYGGYVDIKGPSQEFWSFSFVAKDWCPVFTPCGDVGPGPRYSHSAAVYKRGMYLFGGLVGLVEQNDFWKWDFSSCIWSRIRARSGPHQLVGHSAVVYQDNMLIFGGGRNHNNSDNSLWKFQLKTQTWERLNPATDTSPPSKIYHCTVGVGPSFQEKPVDEISCTASTPSFICPDSSISLHNAHNGERLAALKGACCLNFSTQAPGYCSPSPVKVREKNIYSNIEMKTFSMRSSESSENLLSLAAPEPTDPEGEWRSNNGLCFPIQPKELPPTDGSTLEYREDSALRESGTPCLDQGDVTLHTSKSLPEVLLIVGGKPLSENGCISLWQMKLCEMFLKC